MDWKSRVKSFNVLRQEKSNNNWEYIYQEFKKRLDKEYDDDENELYQIDDTGQMNTDKPVKTRWIYPPVRFDPVNFGTVVIKSKIKITCRHFDPKYKGFESKPYESDYCPDCGVKL